MQITIWHLHRGSVEKGGEPFRIEKAMQQRIKWIRIVIIWTAGYITLIRCNTILCRWGAAKNPRDPREIEIACRLKRGQKSRNSICNHHSSFLSLRSGHFRISQTTFLQWNLFDLSPKLHNGYLYLAVCMCVSKHSWCKKNIHTMYARFLLQFISFPPSWKLWLGENSIRILFAKEITGNCMKKF